jgi:hypothetical protein
LEEGRITAVPYEPRLDVVTVWDLGVGDSTAIWFYQIHGFEIRVIDYYENSGEGLPHYIQVLRDKDYLYGTHYAPHDIEVRDFTTGKSRKDTAAGLGIKFRVVPKLPIEDGIDAVRNLIRKCYFDEQRCVRGIEALRQYKKSWNDKMRCYNNQPDHDWTSHAADAFRYLAISLREKKVDTSRLPRVADSSYDIFGG